MYDYLQPIETMQRISREELAEKLDELLDIVAKDSRLIKEICGG